MCKDSAMIKFRNFILIQSNYGISLYQTHSINKQTIDEYWKGYYWNKIKWVFYPFPIKSLFEIYLFNYLPLTDKDHVKYIKIHNGSLEKWVGELMNIHFSSRIDISYATMRLSTYMSHPCHHSYVALRLFIEYLHHNPHMPIMYPSKKFKKYNLRNKFNIGIAAFKHIP